LNLSDADDGVYNIGARRISFHEEEAQLKNREEWDLKYSRTEEGGRGFA